MSCQKGAGQAAEGGVRGIPLPTEGRVWDFDILSLVLYLIGFKSDLNVAIASKGAVKVQKGPEIRGGRSSM